MNAREHILQELRKATTQQKPFPNIQTHAESFLPVTQIESTADLKQRFVTEVERVHGMVHPAKYNADARHILINLLREKRTQRATCWEDNELPFAIQADLQALGIAQLHGQMRELADAQVGITGAACAIAATGTLVLATGAGRARAASLLPPVHIALVRATQLVPRLEDYIAQQRAAGLSTFAESSNVVLLTGASRTADIEMNVVYGVHGPLELHIVLID